MTDSVDFKKYKYYYNGWVARVNKETGKTEMFLKGVWVLCKPETVKTLDLQAHFGDSDVSELSDSNRDKKLLLKIMKLKNENGKVI